MAWHTNQQAFTSTKAHLHISLVFFAFETFFFTLPANLIDDFSFSLCISMHEYERVGTKRNFCQKLFEEFKFTQVKVF